MFYYKINYEFIFTCREYMFIENLWRFATVRVFVFCLFRSNKMVMHYRFLPYAHNAVPELKLVRTCFMIFHGLGLEVVFWTVKCVHTFWFIPFCWLCCVLSTCVFYFCWSNNVLSDSLIQVQAARKSRENGFV